MSNASHLQALLKKNLLIFKSTFILTIVEIFSPIVIMLLLWGLKISFYIDNLEFQDDLTYITNNSSLLINNNGIIINELCQERNLIAFVGENFPENLSKKFEEHRWEQTNITFKKYDNLQSLLDYVESKDYGTDKDLYPKLCFAVSFKKEKNKYTYKLHYFASPYKTDIPDIPSTEIGVGDRLNLQPDYTSYNKYTQSGFFMSQKYFYDYVLQEETGKDDAQINYMISPKKYDKYIYDNFVSNISLFLAFFTIIAYALPLTINIYRIVKEKETRAKEGMKIMGLSELTYFLSYFIIYFVINLIYSVVITFILKNVLVTIETIYIFLQYFLYGLVVYSLIYFFQSFLERTRIAVIVSLLIYALMYFFSISVFPDSISKGVKIVFCILFPPVALQLGINTISCFEENYNQFEGRIYYEYNKISVFDMYIYFSISFCIYMFIGFYLQNILSHEYGIKKPWYFIFTRNFWGCENKNDNNNQFYDNNIDYNNNNKNNINKKKVNIPSIKANDNNMENKEKLDNDFKENIIEIKINNNKEEQLPSTDELLVGINNVIKNEQKTINNNNIMKANQNSETKLHISDSDINSSKLNFESEELYQINNTKPTDTLKIKNIHKIFDDGKKALNGVSFNLYKNEIFALLGHNGAGKSTLINILTGLYPTTSGSAIYNNENIITSEGLDSFRKYYINIFRNLPST